MGERRSMIYARPRRRHISTTMLFIVKRYRQMIHGSGSSEISVLLMMTNACSLRYLSPPPLISLSEDVNLESVRDQFQAVAVASPTVSPSRLCRPQLITAHGRHYRVDGRLRRVGNKACTNSHPAARFVSALETYITRAVSQQN